MVTCSQSAKTFTFYVKIFTFTIIGAFLAAVAIEVIFIPNELIDGGVVGIAMICGKVFNQRLIPLFLVIFNLPFLYLAYKHISKTFLIHMMVAVVLFAGFLFLLHGSTPFEGNDPLEVIVIGGVTLGIGLGMIIRMGGCLDGTEILGIIASQKKGFTVGQTVFFINFFVFTAAGIIYGSWRPAFHSMMTYFVAMKIMDTVIVGLEETKSVNIISKKTKQISDAIVHELELGLTILYGRGGYSNEKQEVLYVVVERLQLAKLKEIVYREDPIAFVAIQSLHEASHGQCEPNTINKKINNN